MEKVNEQYPKSKGKRCPRMAVMALAVIFIGAGAALADFVLSANINGNTVNYNVFGAQPDSDYTVTIQHDETNQSNTYEEQSDPEGLFSGSGTPGNAPIEPGDSVTVSVYDDTSTKVASIRISKAGDTAPWWAYTGVGTIIWWFS